MFVAVARLELHLPTTTLKEKRSVVQSVAARLRNQFRVSVAEVYHLDNHNVAVLGLATVSNASQHAREVIDAAIRSVEESRLDAELTTAEVEVLPVL